MTPEQRAEVMANRAADAMEARGLCIPDYAYEALEKAILECLKEDA